MCIEGAASRPSLTPLPSGRPSRPVQGVSEHARELGGKGSDCHKVRPPLPLPPGCLL